MTHLHTTSRIRKAAFHNAHALFFMSSLTAAGLVCLFVAAVIQSVT